MASVGSTLKRNPNGEGWIVEGGSGEPAKISTPKQKYAPKKHTKKVKKIQENTKQDPKYIIPEEYRRKIDEGFGGSREDWKKNRRGYYGDMK